MQVNNIGRRVGIVNKEEYKAGNNLFLSIDFDLQKKVYEIIERNLKELMLMKLKANVIKINDLLASMIKNNILSIRKIFEGKNIYERELRDFVLKENNKLDYLKTEGEEEIREIIYNGLKKIK